MKKQTSSLSGANRTDVVVIVIVPIHVTVVEIDVPRPAGRTFISSLFSENRRPPAADPLRYDRLNIYAKRRKRRTMIK